MHGLRVREWGKALRGDEKGTCLSCSLMSINGRQYMHTLISCLQRSSCQMCLLSPRSSFNPLTSLLQPLPSPLCLSLLLRCRRPLSVKAGSSLTCVCALCSHHGNHLFSQAQQQHTNTHTHTHRERQSQSHIHTNRKARQTNSITHTQKC